MHWLLLKNSLMVSAGATLLAVALGGFSALCVATVSSRLRNIGMALSICALAMPPFLVTNCWLNYLGASGTWKHWIPLNIFSLGGTIWILALLLWPISMLAVHGALKKVQASHLETDPGLTGWAILRWVLWPAARPAVALSTILTFVLALNNFSVPALLQVKVLPAEIWIQFNGTLSTLGALTQSWLLILLPALILVWVSRRDFSWPRTQEPLQPRTLRRQLGLPWLCFCGTIGVSVCLISVGLPLLQLLTDRRNWIELPAALAAGHDPLWNSFWYSGLTASVVVGISLALLCLWMSRSYADTRRSSITSKSILIVLRWLPFFVPGVLLGICLIAVFDRPPFLEFYRSAGIVLAALIIRYGVVGWEGTSRAWAAADRDLADAARLDGANRWQLLREIQWPQIAVPMAATWYVVFLLCLWDAESIVLILPPGGETLALRIFNLLHYGHNAQVNALCITLLGMAIAPLFAWAAIAGTRQAIRSARARRSDPRAARAGVAIQASSLAIGFLMALGLTLLATGCGKSPAATQARIESRFFSGVRIIGSRGVAPGQFNKPRSVAVDLQDNLYVVDMTGRVQKFSPDGTYLLSWQMPQTDLGRPKGMSRDAAGNIIVIEPHYQRINHYSTNGALVAQWGISGTNAGEFRMPRAAAVNSQGDMFISEYGEMERVQKFRLLQNEAGAQTAIAGAGYIERATRSGNPMAAGNKTAVEFLASFGTPGTGPGELNRAEGLYIDAHDRLFVADSCNHRIQVFSSDGKYLKSYGTAGSAKDQLSYPYDICVDGADNAFVCEFGNSRIQVFDRDGHSIEIIGGPGAGPGRFANPWSLALDSHGNLYVADSQNHRVQKFIRKSAETARFRGTEQITF